MRSPISLLILGVNAAIAASLMGAAPADAEPGLPRSSAATVETLPLDLSTDPTDAADTPQTDASQTTDGVSSVDSSVDQEQVSQQPTDDRLDRLQQQIEIRQQLNQAEFRSGSPSLSTDFNPLELEQAVQQQINLQNLEDLRQQAGTSPSRTLDRLQFEQRVRQQLRQPSLPEEKTVLAAANSESAEASESASDSRPVQSAEGVAAEVTASDAQPSSEPAGETTTPPTSEAVERSTQTASESLADATASTAQPAEGAVSPPDAGADQSTTAQGTEPEATREAEADQSEPAAEPVSESTPESPEATTAAEPTEEEPTAEDTTEPAADPQLAQTNSPATEPEAEDESEAGDESEAAETEEPDQPEATTTDESESGSDTAQPADTTPPASAEQPQRTIEQAEDRIDRQNRDYPNDSLTPAPEYLDPDPNPLALPTLPEEVELVGTQPVTLRQAVELAVRNNPELRQARLQVEQSQAQLREAQAANFPTVDAQTNFTQSGAEVVTTQTVPSTTPGGTPTTQTEVISQDSTELGAQLQVQYPIFTSGRRPALIRAAESQVRLQQLQLEQATEQLILDTTSNYYDLQQASTQVNIFAANLTQSEQSLRDAQALERAGVGTRFDVLQAEVDVANARQELTQQISQLEIARRQLAQQLNVSQSVNLEAADIVEVAGVWDLTLEESIVQAYKNRSELEQTLIQQEIAQQQRRAALAQLGPQVGFNGAFGLNNDLDQDQGFLYNYRVALTASLSLFDGGAARAQANQQESAIAIAQAQFETARDQIRFQVEQAYSQLDSNFSNIQTTALAVEQAAEALRLARLRFQAGVGTQTDVLRQQTALAQAQVNNLRAILDYNRALATLQRSISNYPEGFLNDQP